MASNILKTGMKIHWLTDGTGFAVEGEKVFFAVRGAANDSKPFPRVPDGAAMGAFISF